MMPRPALLNGFHRNRDTVQYLRVVGKFRVDLDILVYGRNNPVTIPCGMLPDTFFGGSRKTYKQ
jgi:hypothetical protein